MLELLVTTANSLNTAVYFLLYGSYATGSFLVKCLSLFLDQLVSFASTLSTLGSVLYDSLTMFCQDNLQLLQQALVFITSSIDVTTKSLMTMFSKVASAIQAVINVIVSLYTAVVFGVTLTINGIIMVAVYMQKLLVLFGSGVWFLFTLLPLMLYYSGTLCVHFITALYEECHDIVYKTLIHIKNAILFICDIPLESLAGLLVALSLVYIMTVFYLKVKTYCMQKLRYLRRRYEEVSRRRIHAVRTQIAQARHWHRCITIPVLSTRPRAVNEIQPRPLLENSSEKYCVICQERPKCVLLLPCKHVCMCSECLQELHYYNELCPVCRTDIQNTMKIYI